MFMISLSILPTLCLSSVLPEIRASMISSTLSLVPTSRLLIRSLRRSEPKGMARRGVEFTSLYILLTICSEMFSRRGVPLRVNFYGIVQSIEKDSFYGNVVKIINDDGYIFVYSNLDNKIAVKEGDKVKQGNIIGTIGVSATGELADETHLHFEIIKEGTQINPLDLIN